MMPKWIALRTGLFVFPLAASAQSNSIYQRAEAERMQQQQQAAAGPSSNPYGGVSERQRLPVNPELERVSLIAVETKPPHEFKVNDLVTIIVREQKVYKSDASLETKKRWELQTEVEEFFRFLNGHLAAASFTDGNPNIDVSMESRFKGEGDSEREDRLTFRITTRIIDIKPNGQLVVEGRNEIIVDRETQLVTFSGVCRSEDIGPDNTVLSTQIYNLVVDVQHTGSVKNAAKEGWIPRLLNMFGPL